MTNAELRPDLSLQVYEREKTSLPFVVDERTKLPVQVSPRAAEVIRAFAEGRTPEGEDVADVLAGLRDQGLMPDGRGDVEVRAAFRAAWEKEHEQNLAEALEYAAATMPMYRERVPRSIRRFDGSADRELFARIPILSRGELRSAFPAGFVQDPSSIARMVKEGEFGVVESSGTTGDERLRVLADIKRSDAVLVSSRFMNRHLFPSNGLKQAVFTTLHCSGLMCAHDLPQMEMRVFNDKILTLLPPEDVTAPSVAEVKRTVREIQAHGANWLRVNPTYLAHLTYVALDQGLELPKLKLLTTGYEYASRIHRRLLSEAWGAPMFSSYGVTEVQGFGMIECEEGTLHVNDRYFHFELLRDGEPVGPGELGRIVVTTMKGRLPIIRYDIGDVFRAAEAGFRCPCGSVYSHLGRFAGRGRDLIRATDGRVLSTADVDDAISSVGEVRFYQLGMETPEQYHLQVVRGPSGAEAGIEDGIRSALAGVLGPAAKLHLTFVPAIFPERSGKFRALRALDDGTPLISAGVARGAGDAFAPLD